MKIFTTLTFASLLLASLQATAASQCDEQTAINDAEQYVSHHFNDAATFQLAVKDLRDFPRHWSVDLLGTRHDYEVWLRLRDCKVLKVIAQPL